MDEHPLQQVLARTFGLVVPRRVGARLQRMQEAGFTGLVTIEGRDIQTGLPREISISLEELEPPDGGSSTPVTA